MELQLGRPLPEAEKTNWLTTIIMALFHAGAIAALFWFGWKPFLLSVFLWWVAGSLGIGLAYHRLLTHRGFKCPKWFEYFLTICATLALEGGPIFWVAVHRVHHQNSDKPGDPHTPREGKWWSHIGWILTGKGYHNQARELARYTPELARDPVHMFINKWHWVPEVILGMALLAFGGVQYLLWGVFFRVVIGLHCTWLVNSATHMWGSRRFQTKDDSTNNFLIALLTFGEGWHNNHHAHPLSARHGLRWYEIDLNWYAIWLFSKLGLIWDIKQHRLAPNDNPGAEVEKPAGAELLSA